MKVYVDTYLPIYGSKWDGGGHLLATDIDDLHIFAKKLGLKRSWFQDTTFPHYDLVRSKRELALAHGAIALKFGEFPDDLLVKTKHGYERYDANRKGLIQKARKIPKK